MKFLLFIFTGLLATGAFAASNLSDSMDENNVPQRMEERKNESINRPDAIDKNYVPASKEPRQEEEYIESNSDVLDRNARDEEVD